MNAVEKFHQKQISHQPVLLAHTPHGWTLEQRKAVESKLLAVACEIYILVCADVPDLTLEIYCSTCRQSYPVTLAELEEIATKTSDENLCVEGVAV